MKCIYRNFILLSVAVFATMMTSCTDFLTIIPPDKIVHEQYWQTKDDVNGILATAYLKLSSRDAVSRAIVWGELRSDNMTYHPNQMNGEIGYIVRSELKPENNYSRWGIFYEAINNANLVITYAPLVVERDPDFSQGDCDVALGEMYALRALCHFYLLRSFRDIPMAMVPAINDSELPDYKQVHPLEALDMIMNDLNIAYNLVMPTGNYPNAQSNCGRITKNAVLAIKADVNLWRAAFTDCCRQNGDSHPLANANVQQYYTECIKNCEDIWSDIDTRFKKKYPDLDAKDDTPYHLISNQDKVNIDDKAYKCASFDDIFMLENSRESIFELQIDKDLAKSHSSGIKNMYGAKDKTAVIVVPKSFLNKYEKEDLRKYAYTNYPHPVAGSDPKEPDQLVIAKYISKNSPSASNLLGGEEIETNWILYRQTDVMLMMAEALVAQPSVTKDHIDKAFELVNAVNKRSMLDTMKIKKPLVPPTDNVKALELVLDERVRELAFEGKRWFDLVRKALRENTTDNIKFVADKLTGGNEPTTVKNKMISLDNLFFPIYVDELRFNKNLVQNPAYDEDDSTIGMK